MQFAKQACRRELREVIADYIARGYQGDDKTRNLAVFLRNRRYHDEQQTRAHRDLIAYVSDRETGTVIPASSERLSAKADLDINGYKPAGYRQGLHFVVRGQRV